MRALAAVLAVLTVAAAVAAGSAAAAAVGGSFATAPEAALSQWTPARRAAAAPMSALPLSRAGTLGGGAALGGGATLGSAPTLGGPATAATSSAPTSAASTSAIEGTDTGESTLFPNRANGTVYGKYVVDGESEYYQCSGSVIDSPQGDLVLTAGHCVIDPETGVAASWVIFVPGYREGAEPYGAFAASSWVTTPEWTSTAGTLDPDEAGDLAFLVLADSTTTGASVEATVGSLAIAFERSREQVYTQWGYPGEAPYDGQVLYRNTAPYGGFDPIYSPAPIKIASDFTAGASGGPWTIGPTSAPTVLSLTDYYYEGDPHHLYGAYFGSVARQVYEAAAGVVVPPAVTSGAGEPAVPSESTPAPAVTAPSSASTPVASAPAAAPPAATGSLHIVATRGRSTHGEATVIVHVGGPGMLRLSGPAVRTVSVVADVAGNYRLGVSARPGGKAARALGRRGSAAVGIWIRFASPVGVRHASRLVRLVAPRAG
ncbi:MAG TPA: hypothetical protein VHA76_11470 [Solirubrobacterales bacterium]|nr:hypothetical protein [Solirubrobacterales bacterium]